VAKESGVAFVGNDVLGLLVWCQIAIAKLAADGLGWDPWD